MRHGSASCNTIVCGFQLYNIACVPCLRVFLTFEYHFRSLVSLFWRFEASFGFKIVPPGHFNMYKYDMMNAYAAGGRAAMKYHEHVRSDPNAKDAPPSKALKNNKLISKDLNWRPEPLPSHHPLAPINEEYCSKCRRVFEGKGDHAINLLKTDNSGMFFQHWDGYFLEKSASRGCPLCNIVWRSRQRVRSDLARGEEIPMRYDYGSFMSTDARAKREIFAVRFYPFMLLEERGQMMPYQFPLVTVHLEPAASKSFKMTW
jgi:hypothetical protein